MKRLLLILLLALLAFVGCADFARVRVATAAQETSKPAAPSVEDRVRRIESGLLPPITIKGGPPAALKLADRMAQLRVPGVSVAVIEDGRVEWARAWGVKDVETKEPVTAETLFQAGSISKPVAALAALRLVEQGKLSLEEDVNLRLVSWKVPDNEFTKEKKVTLKGLLTHSAGLTVHGFPGYKADAAVPTVAQILNGEKPANTAAIRVDITPGTRWRYSGGGYTVMQQLVEDVAKKPFAEVLEQFVFKPVGMRHSTYEQPLPAKLAAQAATAHVNGQPVRGRFHTYPEMAAAGLWTTPTDLALVAIEIQRSLAGKSNKILSKEMTARMLSNQFEGWGLGPGVEIKGERVRFSHGGSDEGFEAYWVAYNTGRGAVVMTNGDRGAQLALELIRGVAREYGWDDYAARERELAKVDPKVYEAYVGEYEFKINPQLTILLGISTEGGKLFASQNNGPKREWLPASETEFFSLSSGNTLRFVRDAQSAAVIEAVIIQGGEQFKGTKTVSRKP